MRAEKPSLWLALLTIFVRLLISFGTKVYFETSSMISMEEKIR